MENTIQYLAQPPGKDGIYRHIELCANITGKYSSPMDGGSHTRLVKELLLSGERNILSNGTVYLYMAATINNDTAYRPHKSVSEKPLPYHQIVSAISERYRDSTESAVCSSFSDRGKRSCCITTNYAVIMQGSYPTWEEACKNRFDRNWLDDMDFIIEPTSVHKRRFTLFDGHTVYTDFADSQEELSQKYAEHTSLLVKGEKSFVAIDFEYLTNHHETACAVGMVKVLKGVIVQEFYSLIKPAPDDRQFLNGVSGITEEMCADAPPFPEVWKYIQSFVGTLPLVAHNCATERTVINKACSFYFLGENEADKFQFTDTARITGKNLEESCREHGIEPGDHHNPLDDARACARLMMKLSGTELKLPVPKKSGKPSAKPKEEAQPAPKDLYEPLPAEQVENTATPFFGKRVLVTGTFTAFADRESTLLPLLKKLGATNMRSYTGRVEILVAGEGAGPSKMRKAEADGKRIIREAELCEILKNAGELKDEQK